MPRLTLRHHPPGSRPCVRHCAASRPSPVPRHSATSTPRHPPTAWLRRPRKPRTRTARRSTSASSCRCGCGSTGPRSRSEARATGLASSWLHRRLACCCADGHGIAWPCQRLGCTHPEVLAPVLQGAPASCRRRRGKRLLRWGSGTSLVQLAQVPAVQQGPAPVVVVAWRRGWTRIICSRRCSCGWYALQPSSPPRTWTCVPACGGCRSRGSPRSDPRPSRASASGAVGVAARPPPPTHRQPAPHRSNRRRMRRRSTTRSRPAMVTC